MNRTPGRLPRLAMATVVALVVATAGTVVLAVAPAGAVTVRRPLHATARVADAPVVVPFAIEYFGLAATLASGAEPPAENGPSPFGEVRFRTGRVWGPWQPLGQDGAQERGQFSSALISVHGGDAYEVRGLPAAFEGARSTAFNLTDGPVETTTRTPGTPAQAAATCASRADWNADESITAWAKGTDTPAFAPDQVITVHHTAGSNDPNQNYANTVRAIEQYHVLTNGWSDIGYQYLIDPNGVVYEGRYSGHTSTSCATGGGDGSDFAHRLSDDAVVTGAHAGGYNTGNLGVALLGCYDSQSSTCHPGTYGPNDTTPTPAAQSALEQLIARLSTRHGLNATGTVDYVNSVNTKSGVPTVTGHRDWEATACPGGNLYAQLPILRSNAFSDMRPVAMQATVTESTASLSWSPGAAWPAAPRATRFRVTRQGGPTWVTSGTSSSDSGLAADTSYTYEVTALAKDDSASSATSTITAHTLAAASPPPASTDFAIAVAPTAGSVTAAGSTTAQVTTTTGGATFDVNLRVSLQPSTSAVSATLGATTIPAGGSTSMQLVTTPAASGTYTVTVTGTAGGVSHTATYGLTVANAAPAVGITAATCSGASCTFSGSAADPEGGTAPLRWTMPNGSPSSAADVAKITTKYATTGTFTVTLRATDPAKLTGSATATVTCVWAGKGKSKTVSCSTPSR